MNWQDIIFFVGSVIFSIALLPAVISWDPPPTSTCVMTGGVLAAFIACYVSLGFWFSVGSTAVTSLLWFILAYQSLRNPEETYG